jgi:hypothetical protein
MPIKQTHENTRRIRFMLRGFNFFVKGGFDSGPKDREINNSINMTGKNKELSEKSQPARPAPPTFVSATNHLDFDA